MLDNSPESLSIIDDQLFVGTANFLEIFSLDLEHSVTVDLSSTNETVQDCQGFGAGQFARDPKECKNFITTIATFPENSTEDGVIVCGTNAFHPLCNLHDRNEPASFTKLSDAGERDEGFSPHVNDRSIVSQLASNSRFFAATVFGALNVRVSIRMSPGLLQDPRDTTFTVGTPLTDPRWLNDPVFISAHEYGEHMYFFITETAFELTSVFESNPQSFEDVIYSRAIRICKTDDGIGSGTNPEENLFLTFEKARMECSVSGSGNSIPFFYNELKSTFLSQSQDGTSTLYGVFNSPSNGPPGGAICKFSFNPTATGSITRVLDDTEFLVRQESGGSQMWERENAPQFSCPGSSGDQRTVEASERFQLKTDSITPSSESPLLVSSGQFLDKIAVEIVDETVEVVYYTNQQGDIKQVTETGSERFEHTLYAADATNPIRDLALQPGTHGSTLFATASDRILQIPRGQCSNYDSCFTCFDSGDPYCGWDSEGQCRNKFTNTESTLVPSVSTAESEIIALCGARPVMPTPKPITPCDGEELPSTNTNQVEVTSDNKPADCTTSKVPIVTEVGLQGDSDGMSIGIIVGAAVAAFVIGIPIGGFVSVVFYRRVVSSRSGKKKDSSPEVPMSFVPAPAVENNQNNISTSSVNNNNSSTKEVEPDPVPAVEKREVTNLVPPPVPRYVQTNPISAPSTNHTATATGITVQPKVTFSPHSSHTPHTSQPNGTASTPSHKYTNTRHFSIPNTAPHNFQEEGDDDSAFADKDTLPPLKNFPSPGTMYGSLGRHKTSNGVTRKQVPGHKVPRGRSESTTWLRQRSESLSSDISFSSNTSPLQSPISDV